MTIWGFLKVYNEVLRGNLPQCLAGLRAVCDEVFVCDDGSDDDPLAWLSHYGIPRRNVLRYAAPDFARELERKQALLDGIHRRAAAEGPPDWLLWLDGDEVLDADGIAGLRGYAAALLNTGCGGAAFRQVALWQSTQEFAAADVGSFIRLWRYDPRLRFDAAPGLHHSQIPPGIKSAARIAVAPFAVLHYGRATLSNLTIKAAQYAAVPGRHETLQRFDHGAKPLPSTVLPGFAEAWAQCAYDPEVQARIRSLGALRREAGLFAVVIPTYNRGDGRLQRALDSVGAQTWERWICLVLDDGSTDATRDAVRPYLLRDPRFFYLRYPTNRGGVAMNEIGMRLACSMAEWWSRLGSDDWWEPRKLEADAATFRERPDADVVWGQYSSARAGEAVRPGINVAQAHEAVVAALARGGFCVSWACIAARTEALRRVRDDFGKFADPFLRNMEDHEVNRRLAKTGARFHWRPALAGTADAFYTVDAPDGASTDAAAVAADLAMQCGIANEARRGP